MVKSDLIKTAQAVGSLSAAKSELIINGIFAAMQAGLAAGESVDIRGFGSFKPYTRKERKAINLQTKEPMTVPAQKAVKFTAGKTLKASLQ